MTAGPMRAADDDRERVVALLVRHCGAGRLSLDEFDARLDEVYAATTLDELGHCLRELPRLTPIVLPAPPPPTGSRLRRFLRRPTPRWVAVAAVLLAFAVGRQTEEPDVFYTDGDTVGAQELEPELPPLPPAGQQPADRAGAELLVHAAFAQAFNGTSSDEAKGQAIEEPESIEAAGREVARKFPTEVQASVVTVSQLVFTAPTEAHVHFDIDYGTGSIGERRGRAVLIEGRWRVAQETVCDVLTFAGATC